LILPMTKITFLGLGSQKEAFLKRLQEVGVTHLILPAETEEPQEVARELQKVGDAKKFLARRLTDKKATPSQHDYEAVCARRDALGHEEAGLQTELAILKKDKALMLPWGDFDPASLGALEAKGFKVYFYRLGQSAFAGLDLSGLHSFVVSDTPGEVAFVVFAQAPPELGVLPEKLPAKGLSRIEREIEAANQRLAAIQAEYAELARNLKTLEKAEASLTDELTYLRAVLNTDGELENRLFLVRCWSPMAADELVKKIGPEFAFHHYAEEPQEGDRVPVLLSNKPAFAPGEDLVGIYSHPNYSDFDPSGLVLWCFTIFYGMIIGDAGYGSVLLLISVLLQLKVKSESPMFKRMLRLSYMLSCSTIFFGLITASYFGVALSDDSPLKNIMLMDLGTKEGQNHVMLVSCVMGMVHLTLALLIKLYRTKDLAALGWILVTWGGYLLFDGKVAGGPYGEIGQWVLIAGFALVLLFTSNSRNVIIRLAVGLNGVLGVVQLFADVLSYMRLFALGLATMYMCQTFNLLGGMVFDAIPWAWLGALPAVLVLVIGHSINIVLGIMGGVVHGLRLNFLEWYRWCFEGDGLPFKPFRQVAN